MVDKTISDLESIVSLTGDMLFPLENGVGTFAASIDDIKEYLGTLIGVPVGSTIDFAASTPPAGFLECNGAAISRTTYSALFAVIGTVWGVGNGTTTFNLPDMRGYFKRGWANGGPIDTARAFASTQADELKSHTHDINIGNTVGGATTGASGAQGGIVIQPSTTNSVVAFGGAETRPVNVAIMCCIKY